ncbi:hypothetical protein ACFSTH_15085 [Paenibacillus yanchengensis]|uniref:Uncharacterized protein n=1 Tax=Paenibacillus yanchengensis TaxID=2035833 RepID=A0ABW4YGY7_9BACL
MRCGERCFLVTVQIDGEQQTDKITARTSVDARKKVRRMYGVKANVISVVRDNTRLYRP